MAKYLKSFETTTDYNSYIDGGSADLPNISLCDDENEIHYHPDIRIVAKFVTTKNNTTVRLMYSSVTSLFSEIVIDGVKQPSVVDTYNIVTMGEHFVNYKLIDETTISTSMFRNCQNMINITLPDTILTIAGDAFNQAGITELTIPKNVTSMGQYAIRQNKSLVSLSVSPKNTTYDSRDNCNAVIITAQNKLAFGCNTTIIPESVTSLKDRAFIGSGVTTLVIPSNVSSIGEYCFYQSSITNLTVLRTTPVPYTTLMLGSVPSELQIFVPSESVDAYKTTWSAVASKIQAIPNE